MFKHCLSWKITVFFVITRFAVLIGGFHRQGIASELLKHTHTHTCTHTHTHKLFPKFSNVSTRTVSNEAWSIYNSLVPKSLLNDSDTINLNKKEKTQSATVKISEKLYISKRILGQTNSKVHINTHSMNNSFQHKHRQTQSRTRIHRP